MFAEFLPAYSEYPLVYIYCPISPLSWPRCKAKRCDYLLSCIPHRVLSAFASRDFLRFSLTPRLCVSTLHMVKPPTYMLRLHAGPCKRAMQGCDLRVLHRNLRKRISISACRYSLEWAHFKYKTHTVIESYRINAFYVHIGIRRQRGLAPVPPSSSGCSCTWWYSMLCSLCTCALSGLLCEENRTLISCPKRCTLVCAETPVQASQRVHASNPPNYHWPLCSLLAAPCLLLDQLHLLNHLLDLRVQRSILSRELFPLFCFFRTWTMLAYLISLHLCRTCVKLT